MCVRKSLTISYQRTVQVKSYEPITIGSQTIIESDSEQGITKDDMTKEYLLLAKYVDWAIEKKCTELRNTQQ